MKANRLAPVLAALLSLGLLAACGGGEQPAADYAPAHVQAMADAGAFSEELEELDGDTAFLLYKLADYGLSREDLTACAVLRSAGATCEEGAVLVVGGEDETLAAQAEQALKDYVQEQIDANADYRPDEIPKLENALIDRRGQTLLLAVASDLEAARSAVG